MNWQAGEEFDFSVDNSLSENLEIEMQGTVELHPCRGVRESYECAFVQ